MVSFQFPKQQFDYFLVLDFEANGDHKIIKPMEIIEFPIVKVNAKTFEIESVFQQYVEPEVNEICEYCTKVTGISQDMVRGKPHLRKTLQLVDEWMNKEGLLKDGVKFIFVTCGDWDLKTQLPRETAWFNILLPQYYNQWINIKTPFREVTGIRPHGMKSMLHNLHLTLDGRHHSGLDDSKNISKILTRLAEKGFVYKVTGWHD
ncbi:ERI1 exoribonuclease 3 isoform X1 [Patella vulgata]|uniref:ERI1 exoribonuclease 3 isoform X1 n=2 Tax=Patella vulgata TaxID=6465 RepID=UPI00217F408A|nr:ERI1 exoribonuclease 3 isoform X1 [Patella vulgata]